MCGVVAVFLHLIYNTAKGNVSEPLALAHNPIASNALKERDDPIDLPIGPQQQPELLTVVVMFPNARNPVINGGTFTTMQGDFHSHHVVNGGRRCQLIISQP